MENNAKKGMVLIQNELNKILLTKKNSKTTIPLGMDSFDNSIYLDFKNNNNLLIAGRTGSGMFNFFNIIITSLIRQSNTNEIGYIIADTRSTIFSEFNNIPYLLRPIIDDYSKLIEALKWCSEELERRSMDVTQNPNSQDIFVFIGDVVGFINEVGESDELQELIIKILNYSDKKLGFHMIIGSARPLAIPFIDSIKQNINCRLIFALNTKEESGLLLGQAGAELLLGSGDALFYNGDGIAVVHVQTPFISDEEVKSIINNFK